MNYESGFLSFLHEVMEERVKQLSERANCQPDFNKLNQATYDLYVGLVMSYMYESGARDSLILYGLFLKVIDSNY